MQREPGDKAIAISAYYLLSLYPIPVVPASVRFLKEDGKVVEPILASTLQLKHCDRIPDEDLGTTACKVSLDFPTSLQDLSDSILQSAFPIRPRLFAEHFVPGSRTTKGCTMKYCIHVHGNL